MCKVNYQQKQASFLCFVVTLVVILWRVRWVADGLIKRVEGRRAGCGLCLLLEGFTCGLLLLHGCHLLRGGLAGGHLAVRHGGHLKRGLVVHARVAAAVAVDVQKPRVLCCHHDFDFDLWRFKHTRRFFFKKTMV